MATTAAATVRRALLYVPASSPKFLEKSRALSVDNVTYDLEDSVTLSRKADARKDLRRFLELRHQEQAEQLKDGGKRGGGIREVAVRINSVDSGFAEEDLREVLKAPNIDALVIPKVNSASDLHFIIDVLRHTLPDRHPSTSSTTPRSASTTSPETATQKPPLKILALIESALSLSNLPTITTSTPLLNGLIFAAEDFALDLSLTRTPSLSEFLYARSAIVTAARAARLPSAIDLVCTSFRPPHGGKTLQEEAENGRRMGFNGKQCIHPGQVGVVEGVFGVGREEAIWAVRCLVADGKAREEGRGAWTLDGRMVDAPVVGRAEALVERARVCGVDVGGLWEEWAGQEPE